MALSTITKGPTPINGLTIYSQVANHVDINTTNLSTASFVATGAVINTLSSTNITTTNLTVNDSFDWGIKTTWTPVFNAGTSTNVNAIAFLNPRFRLAGNRIYCELSGSIQGIGTATIVANISVPIATGVFSSQEQAHGNGSKYNVLTGNNQICSIFSLIGTQEFAMMVTAATLDNDRFYIEFWYEVI